MLIHSATGPTADGRYLVTYATPGCDVLTTAADCCTKAQAEAEAQRLNEEQVRREEAIKADQRARGLRIMSSDLGGN